MSKRAWTYCSVVVVIAGLVALSLHREHRPLPPPSQLEKRLTAAYNETALKLYAELRKEPGNIAISPYSINTVMTMALAGARSDTEAEMTKVLGLDLSGGSINTGNARLLRRMTRQRAELAIANGLCLTTGGPGVSPAYRKLLQQDYSAEVFTARDVKPINAWVEKRTDGKIPHLLDGLSPQSVCVLLNAVYFHGEWAGPFDKSLTRPARFRVDDDTTVMVPMMYRHGVCGSFANDDYQAISLPYRGSSVAMVVVLPADGKAIGDLEAGLSLARLQEMLEALEQPGEEEETVYLPRFRLEHSTDLIPAFEAMGMTLPFRENQADFGGMVGEADGVPGVSVSQIRHQACLEVDEEGTRVAAATAADCEAAKEPIPFRADRPFLFLLIERQTNAILFMGRVTNPLE